MEQKIIPILMYHSIMIVKKTEIMKSIHVSPASFALQMWLLNFFGYRGCSISEAIKAFKSGSTDKLIALTFDDGYENFYTNALPVLKRYKFTATVYAVTDLLGKHNAWDTKTGISHNKLMDQKQLKDCLSHGIEIGCHTATHKSLINDNIDLHIEIQEAKRNLEKQIGVNVKAFCYPYGHTNDEVLTQVKKAGFTSATTMIRSRATNSDDPLLLPRIPITWHTLPHLFLAKILSKYEDRRRTA